MCIKDKQKNITFDNIEIEKRKFNHCKKLILLGEAYIEGFLQVNKIINIFLVKIMMSHQ